MSLPVLLPPGVVAVRLQAFGILASFTEIARNYWPLYSQVNGQLVVTQGSQRWVGLLDQAFRMAGNAIWVVPAALGAFLAPRYASPQGAPRRIVWILAGISGR